jgi:hypothetical protein
MNLKKTQALTFSFFLRKKKASDKSLVAKFKAIEWLPKS